MSPSCALLDPQGVQHREPGFFHAAREPVRLIAQKGVTELQRNGYDKPRFRREKRHGNAAREKLRIRRSVHRDNFEQFDHAHHGTEKSEKRRRRRHDGNGGKSLLYRRRFRGKDFFDRLLRVRAVRVLFVERGTDHLAHAAMQLFSPHARLVHLAFLAKLENGAVTERTGLDRQNHIALHDQNAPEYEQKHDRIHQDTTVVHKVPETVFPGQILVICKFGRKRRAEEDIDRNEHHRGIVRSRAERRFYFILNVRRKMILPAEHLPLFTGHREHQCGWSVRGRRLLHRKDATEAELIAVGQLCTENQVPVFPLDLAGKHDFGLSELNQGFCDTQRIILVKFHIALYAVETIHALRNGERNTLVPELHQRFQTVFLRRERKKFGTGLFRRRLHLGKIFAGDAHIFHKARAFRHKRVHLLLARLILFVKEFAFLILRLAVFPAGGGLHIALLAGIFEIRLRGIERGALLHEFIAGILLLRNRKGCGESDRQKSDDYLFHFAFPFTETEPEWRSTGPDFTGIITDDPAIGIVTRCGAPLPCATFIASLISVRSESGSFT